MEPAPCLDAAAIDKLQQLGGPEFVVEMIDLFLTYVPQKLAETRRAVTARNWPAVHAAAHSIKSSAGDIGAGTMQSLAARIEQLAADQNGAPIPALLADLEAAAAVVQIVLEENRQSLREA